MNFASVAGHTNPIAILRRHIESGTLPHALLLTGPDRVGKTTLAQAVATTVLHAEAWPGGPMAHPDLWVEDGDAERIGIDRIRAGGKNDAGMSLQDFLARRAYAGGARAAVIGRADRLTEQAANCLLKTLEEPPSDTYLVLCAAVPDRLPETIRSRCQTLPVGAVPVAELASWLESDAVPKDLATTLALLAVGRPGHALRLATDPTALSGELDALEGFIDTAGRGVRVALEQSAKLAPTASAEGRERAEMQVGVWTSFLRDLSCYCHGVPELVVWTEYASVLSAWAPTVSAAWCVAMLDACAEAREAIASYANPRLTYDVLFLQLFGGESALPSVQRPARPRSVTELAAGAPPPKRPGGRRTTAKA